MRLGRREWIPRTVAEFVVELLLTEGPALGAVQACRVF